MPRLSLERCYYDPVVERMSREELLGLQWRRLKPLLAYAYTIPFYRRRFQQAHLAPDDINTWEDFRRLPLVTKTDLIADQNQYPPFGSRLGVPEDKLVRFHLTSGTSGKGQQVLGLTRTDLEMLTVWCRGFHWAGVRRGDLVVNLSPISLGPQSGPDARTRGYDRMGASFVHLGIAYSTEQKVHMLKRFNPHFIFGFIRRVRQLCLEMGIDPRRDFPLLKGAVAGGGDRPASPEEAMALEESWNIRLSDFYGSTETKTGIANTCEHGVLFRGQFGMYHIFEDYCLFEFLDRDTRQPVPLGEPGEIVITNLTLEASPLIRFATNDKAIPLPPSACDCGRPFMGMRVGAIERYDDMIKIRGMNLWPSAVETVVFGYAEVAEYQARVVVNPDGHEEVNLVLEFKPEVPRSRGQELLATIGREVKDTAGLRMNLEEAKEPLPRFDPPLIKPRRWLDLRRQPAPAPRA